jgi:hypothetical protein
MAIKTASGSGLTNSLSSGLVLLNTTSFSGVASQAVPTIFSPTYANYLVTIHTNSPTADNSYYLKLRVGATDTSTGYFWSYYGVRATSTANQGTSANDTAGFYIGDHDLGSQRSFYSASINIFGPNLANATSVHGQFSGLNTGGAQYLLSNGGWHDSLTQFDGFNIIPTAGNISGTVKTYGYN